MADSQIKDAGKVLRLRIFAGPNGSGKSTVIQRIRAAKVNGRTIDFGYYINADDIATELLKKGFSFKSTSLKITPKKFIEVACSSGLINESFPKDKFKKSFSLKSNLLKVKDTSVVENLAQVTADVLRKLLLSQNEKFSFETVFSHESKLKLMKDAIDKGYKVYLYFFFNRFS